MTQKTEKQPLRHIDLCGGCVCVCVCVCVRMCVKEGGSPSCSLTVTVLSYWCSKRETSLDAGKSSSKQQVYKVKVNKD